MLPFVATLLGGLVFAQAESGQASMLPPNDPEEAVAAEYRMLKDRGTREALELFIARHPDHPLAIRAREDILKLAK